MKFITYNIMAAIIGAACLTAPVEAAALPLTLHSSIERAMENNKEVQMAGSSREAARWQAEKAKGLYQPTLEFTHSSSQIGGQYWQVFHVEDVPSKYFINTLSASLPLVSGGRIENTNEQARLGAQISELQLENTKIAVTYQVTQSYYHSLACQHLQKVRAEGVMQLAEHLKNVESQYRAGTVTKADVLRSEVQLANARQQLVAAEYNTGIAYAQHNKLLGLPLGQEVVLQDELAYEPWTIPLHQCIETGLKRRTEQAMADKGIQSAAAAVKVAEGEKKLNVALVGLYSTYDTHINEFNTKQWMVGVSASWKIFDGQMTEKEVKTAQAKLSKARQQAEDLAGGIELEVRQAYASMAKAKSNIATQQAAMAKAAEDFTIAQARYGVNLGTNLDVMDAHVSLTTAKTAYIEALYDHNVSRAALVKAMGIGASGK